MTVKELIELLATYPADLPVVYNTCSEYALVDAPCVETLSIARADGWVHNKRPDKPTAEYLVIC